MNRSLLLLGSKALGLTFLYKLLAVMVLSSLQYAVQEALCTVYRWWRYCEPVSQAVRTCTVVEAS